MDKFKNRIKYYLVGFLIGVVAVAFFFGQRGCTWLPGNRVKAVIAENTIVIGDSVLQILHCLAEDSQPIFDILNTTGDVDFGGSQTRTDPKIYKIDGDDGLSVFFKLFEDDNFDSYSEIINITAPELNCDVSASNTNKQPLVLPRRLIMQIIESRSFTYYPIVDCQVECYGINEDSLTTMHRNALQINTSNQPDLINKVYDITTVYDKGRYLVQYEIGENRTRIKNIKFLDAKGAITCDCE